MRKKISLSDFLALAAVLLAAATLYFTLYPPKEAPAEPQPNTVETENSVQ